jgi:hypothetical protein
MVYVMIVSILAAGVWSHITMMAAQARIAYQAAHKQAMAKLAEQAAAPSNKDIVIAMAEQKV